MNVSASVSVSVNVNVSASVGVSVNRCGSKSCLMVTPLFKRRTSADFPNSHARLDCFCWRNNISLAHVQPVLILFAGWVDRQFWQSTHGFLFKK